MSKRVLEVLLGIVDNSDGGSVKKHHLVQALDILKSEEAASAAPAPEPVKVPEPVTPPAA